jgi:Subtilase family
MAQTNFLIGRGELLTHDIEIRKGGAPKQDAYTLAEARHTLTSQLQGTVTALSKLPAAACPQDMAVARMTLHPEYIAKSYFPTGLLRAAALRSVGSRTVAVTPRKWTRKGDPREVTTTEIFVAGQRDSFEELITWVQSVRQTENASKEIVRVERFTDFAADDRIKGSGVKSQRFFEVGVHLLANENSSFIQTALREFSASLDVVMHEQLALQAGSLWFVPVEGTHAAIQRLAQFAFIRVIRPVPPLRGLRPVSRSAPIAVSCQLPNEMPVSSEPRVAILDGGLPRQTPLTSQWLKSYKLGDSNAKDAADGPSHGLAVTSAYLFGPLTPGGVAPRPYAPVDHVRVLDDDVHTESELELYRTLGHIEEVLLSRQYEFINLSLGPDLPVDDDDVHAWTSVIDDLLSDGDTFMSVAAGNNGERDPILKFNRVQVPADCVNAVAVGSASDTTELWTRARYSAVGPGRRPGVVKPDLMAFGGDAAARYFHALHPNKQPELVPLEGTSFAAPYLLRNAVGIRAVLGQDLTPLAIKTLLVHSARQGGFDKAEVGWGKVPDNLADIITSPPGVARVVYQGELKPGKYLRASIPIPKTGLQGRVKLRATFCYASPVDPQEASCYTRAGLEITFRPDVTKISKDKSTGKLKAQADSKSFFETSSYATEEERRADWGKWETTLHAEQGFIGTSLNGSVFDIHYNAREAGAATVGANKIKYALVVTVEAAKHQDLYNEILRSFASVLIPIQPKVTIPISL